MDWKETFWKPRVLFQQAVQMVRESKDKTVYPARELFMSCGEEHFGYPRPMLVRDSYFSLNGEWEFAPLASREMPGYFTRTIRVPYPPQSERSGAAGITCGDRFWYRKRFVLPKSFVKDRVILHFGAVDQVTEVYVNQRPAGRHEGGYLPFYFDVTKLIRVGEENEILVYVNDALDIRYPYGKQTQNPGGMWYTPFSGIWKTVWLESVDKDHVTSAVCRYEEPELVLTLRGTADTYEVTFYEPTLECMEETNGVAGSCEGKKELCSLTVKQGVHRIPMTAPKLWTPQEPWIYRIRIKAGKDVVETYTALRTVSIETVNDTPRILLNHKPVFLLGVLDQGYYSEGLVTPPNDRCYTEDILRMKKLGFNLLRKHIKVEPECFYTACDRLGMMVLQDMVNNGNYDFATDTAIPTFFSRKGKDKHAEKDPAVREFFGTHCRRTQALLRGHACVVGYTIFNEGWGQSDSDALYARLKAADPTRFYDSASGWFKNKESDVESEHVYFHKVKKGDWKRPALVTECGGFTRNIPGHVYRPGKPYGYGSFSDEESLTDRITELMDTELLPLVSEGLCGAVLTQLSDIEEEINGFYTYDRAVCKVDPDRIRRSAEALTSALDGSERADRSTIEKP